MKRRRNTNTTSTTTTTNNNEDDEEGSKMASFMEEGDEYEVYVSAKDKHDNLNRMIRIHPTDTLKSVASNEYPLSQHSHDTHSSGRMIDDHQTSHHHQVQIKSLLEIAAESQYSRKIIHVKELQEEERRRSEEIILKEAQNAHGNILRSNIELATGVEFLERLKTSWSAPSYIRNMREAEHDEIRKKWHILIDGEECPPPVKTFREMKLPKCILDCLKSRNIQRPTPIQVQALPVLLSGVDIIGIAFTGSGKTLTFSLPMVMLALEEEMNMPVMREEGPIGLILAPSRELARQTYDLVIELCKALHDDGFPEIRATLIIGGENKRTQTEVFLNKGIHSIVATPGRLNDLLKQRKLNMNLCKYMVLDEADRMLDFGFDEAVHGIINYFKRQRQTVLFSATMPQKVQDFAKATLIKPIFVNVGRAGAANLDVIQEVEYVKSESKLVYLLECLQKTAPPVIIFCDRQGDVDEIYEYLLVKGVATASIHGGKDQAERNEAILSYKEKKKDVLVATDVAAKGLDFPDIQHVINYTMPNEIENYVHRIGRTGRCGKTGVATTFINKDIDESILLDLKHLLKEAKQRIPPILQALFDPSEMIENSGYNGIVKACPFCGGLGHRITECPKLEKDAKKLGQCKRDSLVQGSGTGNW